MSIATTPDQTEIQSSIKAWAKAAEPVTTVRAQETDPDAWKALWPQLTELGLFGVAVAEEHGGAGAEIVDLACMLETAAAAMAPGPVLSTALAGVLVSRAGGEIASALGEQIAEGGLPVGLCPGFGVDTLDASGAVTGDAGIVYGGTVDGGLLLPVVTGGDTRWALLEPGTEGVRITPSTPYDISASIARVSLENVTVPADRILDGITTAHVHHLFVTLAAAEAAGVADYTLTSTLR